MAAGKREEGEREEVDGGRGDDGVRGDGDLKKYEKKEWNASERIMSGRFSF